VPYEEPTARIAVELRVRSADGSDRWEWRACQVQPESEDHIYTHHDMCAAIRGYASLASYAIPAGKYPSWRIVIRGKESGRVLATYEWAWDEAAHRYRPNGLPWCWWPSRDVLPDRVLLNAARFSARPRFEPAKLCGADATCLLAARAGAVPVPAQRAVPVAV